MKNSILQKIQFTMTDRHVVNNSFRFLLDELRGSLTDQTTNIPEPTIGLFCGMHLLVNLADVSEKALLVWESLVVVQGQKVGAGAMPGFMTSKSESSSHRLVRTCNKALHRNGNEQCGVYQQFAAYMRSEGTLCFFI